MFTSEKCHLFLNDRDSAARMRNSEGIPGPGAYGSGNQSVAFPHCASTFSKSKRLHDEIQENPGFHYSAPHHDLDGNVWQFKTSPRTFKILNADGIVPSNKE